MRENDEIVAEIWKNTRAALCKSRSLFGDLLTLSFVCVISEIQAR